jgi:signal peptidase II
VDAKSQAQPSGAAALAGLPAWRLAYLSLAAAVFLADRLTKILIESWLPLYGIHPVVPGLFQIVHVTNEGIAFGLFADSQSAFKGALLIAVSAVALAAVVYMLWTAQAGAGWQLAGLALILGGAAGNLLDRIREGRVVDFLDVYVGEYHWPAFNVADSAIVIGGALLLVSIVCQPTKQR